MSGAKRMTIWGLLAMSMIQTAQGQFDEPPEEPASDESAEMPFFVQGEPAAMANSQVEEVRRKHEGKLLKIDGVEGVSIESDEIGEDSIVVFVRDRSVVRKVPKTLDGVPVRTEVTGEFDAFRDAEDVESLETPSPAPKKQPKARSTTTRKAATTKTKTTKTTKAKTTTTQAKTAKTTTTQAKRGPASLLESARRPATKPRQTTARKPKS